jgi:hypothetical protein
MTDRDKPTTWQALRSEMDVLARIVSTASRRACGLSAFPARLS